MQCLAIALQTLHRCQLHVPFSMCEHTHTHIGMQNFDVHNNNWLKSDVIQSHVPHNLIDEMLSM